MADGIAKDDGNGIETRLVKRLMLYRKRKRYRTGNKDAKGWISIAILLICCPQQGASFTARQKAFASLTPTSLLQHSGPRMHYHQAHHRQVSCWMKNLRFKRSSQGRERQTDDDFDLSPNTSRTCETEKENEYNFWRGDTSVDAITRDFNMDLQNLAMEDPEKAQDALEVMQDLYQRHSKDSSKADSIYIQPNAACYTTVMDGWVQSDYEDAAMKAQILLDRLQALYDETNDESLRPNEVSFMLVCQAWADTYTDDFTGETAERAEKILQRMKEQGIQPSVKVYTAVLLAWCKRAGKVQGAMAHAEELLQEMESYSSQPDGAMKDRKETLRNDQGVRPNVITYTTYIGGLARSKEHNLAERAEDVLDRMKKHGIQPDMVAYTSVLNALSKCQSKNEREKAATKAVSIIEEMEGLYDEEYYYAKPSLITYSTAINAIGNSLDPSAPELAENMLRHMYELHDSKRIEGLKPSTATFNAVITAMARSKLRRGRKTAKKAEQLLVEMFRRSERGEKHVMPNVKTWGGVLLAWAESGLPDAAENAQRVLNKMEDLYKNGDTTVGANVVCFTTVIGAWCRAGHVDRAEELLMKMEELFEITGERDLRPNSISYVTMIDGFVRNNAPNAAQKAQDTVNRMIKLYAKDVGFTRPSKIVFNTLINAYSKSSEPGAAQAAEQILQWMENQYREAGDKYLKPGTSEKMLLLLHRLASHTDLRGRFFFVVHSLESNIMQMKLAFVEY